MDKWTWASNLFWGKKHVKNGWVGVGDVLSADKFGKVVMEGVEEWIKPRNSSGWSLHRGCWGKNQAKWNGKNCFGRKLRQSCCWAEVHKISAKRKKHFSLVDVVYSILYSRCCCCFFGEPSPSLSRSTGQKGTCSGPKSFIMYAPSLFCSSQHEHVRHINKIKKNNMNQERAWMWI